MRGSLFQIATFIETTATRAEKAELPLQLEKVSPRHVDLPPFVSVEPTHCLKLFIKIKAGPGVMLTSLSS
jgi:hypothetical protein